MPTCPLTDDKKDELIEQLCKKLGEYVSTGPRNAARGSGLVGQTTSDSCPLFHSYHSTMPHLAGTLPHLGQRRGSLQSLNLTEHMGMLQKKRSPNLNQRRVSLTDLRLPSNNTNINPLTLVKPGNLVSYEDMIRNSPRLNSKPQKPVTLFFLVVFLCEGWIFLNE